ncbi:MAG: LytR/AlgR family response regulator transcription factor [Mangrovibacterium sp.]
MAIDDEPLALTQLAKYIEKTPFLELVSTSSNAIEAIDKMRGMSVDLLFVDINMPELNGLDFVRSLVNGPRIIFTTAYSEYAIDGFKVDALDYLLKPIGYVDFLRSAEKARNFFALQQNNQVKLAHDYLFVKSEYKTVKVTIDDITHIESLNEYLCIFQSLQQPLKTLGSMKQMEEALPADSFMRIHRSFIVNLKKINEIERNHIIVGKGVRIPIGDMYKEVFQQEVSKRLLSKK